MKKACRRRQRNKRAYFDRVYREKRLSHKYWALEYAVIINVNSMPMFKISELRGEIENENS